MRKFDITPTIDLLKEVQLIEREIETLIQERNCMLDEIYKRIPTLKNEEEFKHKVLKRED